MSVPYLPNPTYLPISTLYDLLRPITIASSSPRARFINWGRTFSCTPLAIFEPENEYQCRLILELARREDKGLRVVGVGHSPSDLACTKGFMLSMVKMSRVIEVNVEKGYIISQAGITLHDLHDVLAEHGLAMSNVGSISEQTLGGVVTTATHGSGITFGVLSTQILALDILLADGSRVHCSRLERSDLFIASICGLGSTGVILTVQMAVETAFRLKEVQETVSFEDGLREMEHVVEASEHVRYWWFTQAGTLRVSSSNRTQEPLNPAGSWLWHSLFGYHIIQLLLFIARFLPILNTWIAIFAAWIISDDTIGVDDSHKIFNVDCRYPQHTTEWAIPYENTRACLLDLRAWLDEERLSPDGLRHHFPIEIRFTEADDIWLSPSTGQRTCWLGIVQYKPYGCNVPYQKLFSGFEAIVSRHAGRPHWAKAHYLRPDSLRKLYPHFDDFVHTIEDVDPQGMFRNEYIQRHIFGWVGPGFESRAYRSYKA